MPEYQQIKQSKKTNTIFQKQATPVVQTPVSNPYSIIQRAKVNPRSLTRADIMQLQRTIGNRAVGRLLSSIGSSSTAQQATVQRQEIPEEETCPSCMQRQEISEEEEPSQVKFESIQRQEIPDEEEPLQGKMIEPHQLQEIPEEEEPIQGKMIETVQRQEIPEEEEPLQGKMTEVIQRQEIPEEEETLQGKLIEPIQLQEIPEEEEPLQGKMAGTVQLQEIPEEEPLQTKRENNTGMPDNLKAGMESLSGINMSDVRVHYNSSKPTEVGALAYTQGTNIHVAPGQERHLPHEAWHVVQQMQGRVKPTMQLKDGVSVNDDEGLEHEADEMGTKVTSEPENRGGQALITHELDNVVQQNGDALCSTFQSHEKVWQHLTTETALSLAGKTVIQEKEETTEAPQVLSEIPCPFQQQSPESVRTVGTKSSPVQRKTLEQAGLKGELKDTGERTTVGDPHLNARVYNKNVLGKTGEKREGALVIAAEENANVGEIIDNWRIRNKFKTPASMFTQDSVNLGKPEINTLDPFFLFITVRFDTIDDTYFLHMVFQHAADLQGYVEALSDTSNPGTADFPSMYKKKTEKNPDKERNPKYSDKHDQGSKGNLLSLTEGENGENLDAYTKIAGEGARWVCVRKHAANINNDSHFYTRSANEGEVLAVTFRKLWISWSEDFNKKYNITDQEVKEVILRKSSMRETVAIRNLSASDYDLDRSCTFNPEAQQQQPPPPPAPTQQQQPGIQPSTTAPQYQHQRQAQQSVPAERIPLRIQRPAKQSPEELEREKQRR